MKKLAVKRAIGTAAVAVMAVTGLGISSAPPVSAASYGWVYLVTPRWWGWCPGAGNGITSVHYVVAGVSEGGDGGDDIVYARVRLGAKNTVVMADTCRWNTPQGSTAEIRPTRNGQAWFIGTDGGAWGN